MLSSKASAKLTRMITIVVGVILLGLMIFAKPILVWFGVRGAIITVLLLAFYICCVPAWITLVSILKIMNNVINDNVFSTQTVKLIRILSWCCVVVSIVCFICGLRYIPLWIFALGSVFMTLILRVLKNVMERAVEIKDENDFTV